MIELEDLGSDLQRQHRAAMPDVATLMGAGDRRRTRQHRLLGGCAAVVTVLVVAVTASATIGRDEPTRIQVVAAPLGSPVEDVADPRWGSLPDLPDVVQAPVATAVVDDRLFAAGVTGDPQVARLFRLAVNARSWERVDLPGPSSLAVGNGDGSTASILATVKDRLAVLGVEGEALQVVVAEEDGGWTQAPPPPTTASASATFLGVGDDLLLWGGEDGERNPVARGLVLAAGAEQWSELPDSPMGPRAGTHAVAWQGRAVLLGGGDAARGYTDGAILDLATRTWSAVDPLPGAVSVAAVAVVDDDVVGLGIDADGRLAAATLAVDGSWQPVAGPGPSARRSAITATSHGVFVWSGAAGAAGQPPVRTAWLLSVDAGEWTALPDSPAGSGRCLAGAAADGSAVYLVGGLSQCGDAAMVSSSDAIVLGF